MTDMVIRPWKPEDLPAMREIWKACFGDSDGEINAFCERFLRENAGLVAEWNGRVASAGYLIPGLTVRSDKNVSLSACCVFALGTHPACRGRKIGLSLHRALQQKALREADCVITVAEEPSLLPVYLRDPETRPLSAGREAFLSAEELIPSDSGHAANRAAYAFSRAKSIPAVKALRLTPEEYAEKREKLLGNRPHALYPPRWLELAEVYGKSFWQVGDALAAVSVQGECLEVSELLTDDPDWQNPLAGLLAILPAPFLRVCTPLYMEGPGTETTLACGRFRAPELTAPQDFFFPFFLS